MATQRSKAHSIDENFFVFDSMNLDKVESKLYGYSIVEEGALIPSAEGAFVHVHRNEKCITITQDYIGSFGVYLYEKDGYFAFSNSFNLLVDYVKKHHPITLNERYADYFLTVGLCSTSFDQTLVNEITILDRAAVVYIDVESRTFGFTYTDYEENTVDIDSSKGIEILDKWYDKWARIIHDLQQNHANLQTDLSGGFDSRIVFTLFLNESIDVNSIHVISIEDQLHTHTEDYEIATQIAQQYGFTLNSKKDTRFETINYSMKDILNSVYYVKSGFHKQIMPRRYRSVPVLHRFTGSGGECIRNYWNMTREEYVTNEIKWSNGYSKHLSERLAHSIRMILDDSIEKIQKKFERCGRPIADSDIMLNMYRETRCRNHFGRGTVEAYLGGSIHHNPLLDPDLHKLKLSTTECSDKNLLMTLIMLRYAPELIQIKIEGGRSIAEETIAYARALNMRFPYKKVSVTEKKQMQLWETFESEIIHEQTEALVRQEEFEQKIREIFASPITKQMFTMKMDSSAYDRAVLDVRTRKFHPLSYAYAVNAISKSILDTWAQSVIHQSTSADTVIDIIQSGSANERQMDNISYLDHYITARFDIQHRGNADNTLEILEMTDQNAVVYTPAWMQKNGHGYSIESAKGKVNMKLRASGDGQVTIRLMGQNVAKPHGQRHPFWIDYYKLVINGKTYISTCTPLWHDKGYNVTVPVRDNDIIDISAEWQPHDDVNHSIRPMVPCDVLDNYTTLRLDIINAGSKDRNAISITNISDNDALIYEPEWFRKNGKGCVVESKHGSLDLVFRCIGDGYLTIAFKSRHNADEAGRAIPYWIDCQRIRINDEEQLNATMTVSHDQAYRLSRSVSDGDIIKLSVLWIPNHSSGALPETMQK